MNRIKEQFVLWRVRRGNSEAFSEIYDTYYQPLHRYINYRLKSAEDADDIASQVFVNCLAYLQDKTKQEVRDLRSFLYQIARNAIAEHYRKTQGREVLVADPAPYEAADNHQQKSEFVLNEEFEEEQEKQRRRLALIQATLKDLKPEYREVIVLRHIDELTIAEIAEILGKTENSVRVLLHRARASLQKLIQQN